MYVFPAFVTPATMTILLPFIIIIPVLLIVFVVWHVRKLNSIDGTLREILENLKKGGKKTE